MYIYIQLKLKCIYMYCHASIYQSLVWMSKTLVFMYIYICKCYIYIYILSCIPVYIYVYIYIYILFQKVVTARSWFSLDECGLHNQDVQSYTEKSISSQTRTVGSDSRIQRSSFVTQH